MIAKLKAKFKHSLRLRKLDRIRCKRYHDKIKKLGFLGSKVPTAYLASLKSSSRWHKLHPERHKIANRKYLAKVKKKMGTTGEQAKYMYSRLYGIKSGKGKLNSNG